MFIFGQYEFILFKTKEIDIRETEYFEDTGVIIKIVKDKNELGNHDCATNGKFERRKSYST